MAGWARCLRLVLVLALVVVAASAAVATAKVYSPADKILLNCGSTTDGLDADGRRWVADTNNNSWLEDSGKSSIMAAADQLEPMLPSSIPYMTARVFTMDAVYNFSVNPRDRHWLRLHFYPSSYNGLEPQDFRFSVATSTGFTLLHNFSVYLTTKALTQAYLVREYSLPRSPEGFLTVTFSPTPMVNVTYAFINGIEVISMPDIFGDPATMVGFADETVDVEFSLNVSSGATSLNVTFAPSSRQPPGGASGSHYYAFVNGIEIVPTPDVFTAPVPTFANGGRPSLAPLRGDTAFQTMYRLNVGGAYIPPSNDSGLSRSWFDDTPFVRGPTQGIVYTAGPRFHIKYPSDAAEYAAPTEVYLGGRSMGSDSRLNQNSNLTWTVDVDSNFTYIARLHFCELQLVHANQRVFDVYINNKTAQTDVDVLEMTTERGVPVYKDYAVTMSNDTADEVLWVAMHPSVMLRPQFYDAILNGLEVFKVNNSGGSLAAPDPSPFKLLAENELGWGGPPEFSTNDPAGMARVMGGTAGGAAAAGILAAICVVVYNNKRNRKPGGGGDSHTSAWLPLYHSHTSGKSSGHVTANLAGMCRHFSFAEIKAATKNFSNDLAIGVGGFGVVYRGVVDNDVKVAVKRSNPSSEQGINEFQTEVEMLSKLRHRHLVSLIGFCEEDGEMVLVYDYMEHGTLREHLYHNGGKPTLSWRHRLDICIGAARGLHYLHTGAKYTIIHRDVKTTNILVDENWVAKVSDFGLSKSGPTTLNQSHVSTVVKGSFGYLDPEYFRCQQLTDKSDVYSFGVVLFEVLLARPALDPALPRDQVSLADYALACKRGGTLPGVVDPAIKHQIAPECLVKFADTAEKCLAENGADRPGMADVLWNLESAMLAQDTFDGASGRPASSLDPATSNDDGSTASATTLGTSSMSHPHETCVVLEADEVVAERATFSQLVQPTGR
uniref:Protein kinase domain-containing protein n=1 Tax=Oryza brachyantha TaxID=4533 RepID=J3KYC2_ORYBR